MRSALSLLALGLAVSDVAAQPVALTGDALSRLVAGRTVDIDTPLGTTVPIEFREDGTLLGRAGAVAFYLGSMTDKGRWWIKGDRVCQRWTRWFDAEVSCMRFQVQGRRIHWQSDSGKSGTGTLAGPDPAQLRARAYALGGSHLAPKPVAAATSVPTTAPPPGDEPKVASPQAAAWHTRVAGVVRPAMPTAAPIGPVTPLAVRAPSSLSLQAAPVLVHEAVLRAERPEVTPAVGRAGHGSNRGDEPEHPDGLAAMAEAVHAASEFRWCQSALEPTRLPVAFPSTGEAVDEASDVDVAAPAPVSVEGSGVPGDRHGCFAVEPVLMRLSRAKAARR